MRKFTVETDGKKFLTVCRDDGFWVMSMLSKNTKAARRKGGDWVSGKITGFYKYTTAAGRASNQRKEDAKRALFVSENI